MPRHWWLAKVHVVAGVLQCESVSGPRERAAWRNRVVYCRGITMDYKFWLNVNDRIKIGAAEVVLITCPSNRNKTQCQIGIHAPRSIPIHRKEVQDAILAENNKVDESKIVG
jgi:carbon storage regulator CsrA